MMSLFRFQGSQSVEKAFCNNWSHDLLLKNTAIGNNFSWKHHTWLQSLEFLIIPDVLSLFITLTPVKYQDFSCYCKITSLSHAVKILFLSFTGEDIGVAIVTKMITIAMVG